MGNVKENGINSFQFKVWRCLYRSFNQWPFHMGEASKSSNFVELQEWLKLTLKLLSDVLTSAFSFVVKSKTVLAELLEQLK